MLLLCSEIDSKSAAAPTLDYIFPPALKRGATSAVTVGGKFDPWPPSGWTDCSGVTFNAETNTGKFSIRVAEDAPLGPHLLRLYNADGASAPHCFLITREQDELEKEPNDNFKQAQVIEKLPTVIAGRLEKNGDTDCFAIKLRAGKWLVARVDAFSLGSPVDAVLHLFTEQGVRIAFNHDSARSPDPLLAHRVEKSGTYILQIAGFVHPPGSEVRYSGSPATIYRLAITDGPFVEHVFPAGVQRGQKTSLHLIGWNLGETEATRQQLFDSSGVAAELEVTNLEVPGLGNPVPIAIGDLPEQSEIEPNDTCEQAQLISPPCVVDGRISTAGDEDRFRFNAKKGERLEFRIQSASLGFPLEPTLRIADSGGQPLAREEERGLADPKLTWTAPTNGSYVVAIGDLFHRGGEDFVYRFLAAPPTPDFKVTAADHAVRLEPGKTHEMKLEITRLNGQTNRLTIAAEMLPEGVTAKVPEVPAKGGEIKVALMAAPDAKPANQPLRIVIRSVDSGTPKTHPALFDLRGKESSGERLINQTDQLWLTVLPKPVAASATPPDTTK